MTPMTLVKGESQRRNKNGLYRLTTRLKATLKTDICRSSKVYKGVQRWSLWRVFDFPFDAR